VSTKTQKNPGGPGLPAVRRTAQASRPAFRFFTASASAASASADFCLSFAIPDARRGLPAPAPRTNPSKNLRPVPAGGHKKTQPRFPAKRRPRLRVRLSFLTGTRLSQPEVPPARPKPARRFGGRPPGKTSFCEGPLPCHRLARRQPRKTFFPAPLPARPAPTFAGPTPYFSPAPGQPKKGQTKTFFFAARRRPPFRRGHDSTSPAPAVNPQKTKSPSQALDSGPMHKVRGKRVHPQDQALALKCRSYVVA